MSRPPGRRRPLSAPARLALCAALALAAAACPSRRCRERLVDDKTSPDNRYTAALFVRNCGGARDVLTHVNLHAGMGAPRADLNGVVEAGAVFAIDGERRVKLTWRDDASLLIECVGCGAGQVSARESSWRDVKIAHAARD